jgi:hypothetical protein
MLGSRTKTPVERNIKQAGLMTKDVGQQASYGVPYESVPTVTPVKSEKPRQTTIKRIEEQNQLRMDVKKYNPGSFYFCCSAEWTFVDPRQRSKLSISPSCKGSSPTLLRSNT